jgi:prolipoprotein diacylglyceryl transferase
MHGPFASIPSPAHGIFHLGPLPLHAYGLMLAIGVVVAARLAEPRATARGFEPGLIGDIAVKVVIGGVIGARVYHLFTGYDWSKGFLGIFRIWEGGLSIWGAVLGGLIPVVWIARRRNLDAVLLMDAIAPCVALAQAIGRWGNWFNQELFGRPTTLPWALEIDPAHRPAGYEHYATFHPTFLYESLWCILIFVVITALERRGALRRGQSVSLYVAMYCFERFFMELLRIDDATKLFGVRFNALLSAVLFVVGTVLFLHFGRADRPDETGS